MKSLHGIPSTRGTKIFYYVNVWRETISVDLGCIVPETLKIIDDHIELYIGSNK
jgi:hypothetical protein